MSWRALEVLLSAPDVGWWGFGIVEGFVPAETDVSVMPVSSQVSVVLGAVHGNRGVLR
jgi:hypothetical protein